MELLLPVLFFRMDRVFGVVASDNLIPPEAAMKPQGLFHLPEPIDLLP
jgi:hypothetical protein